MADGLYYPSLSGLITIDKFPESLNFLHQGLTSFLDKLYYREFRIERANDGGTFSFYIEVISNKNLAVEIPGTQGMRLILNPDYQAGDNTVIPISASFTLGILKYIKYFDINSFILNPLNAFETLVNVLRVDDEVIVNMMLNSKIEEEDPLYSLATELNTNYSANISLPLSDDAALAISNIISSVNSNSTTSLRTILYNDYIIDVAGDDKSFQNLSTLFYPVSGFDPLQTLAELVTPYLKIQTKISAGIEVPRSILQPMKLVNGTTSKYEVDADTTVNTTLILSLGIVYFDSQSGKFSFEDNITLNFKQPHTRAQIGNSPLTIGFLDASLKLDKRPGGSSTGYHTVVSVASADIGLPAIFDQTNPGPHLVATNIIIDSDNGFSGTVSIQGGGTPPTSVLKYNLGDNGLQLELTSFAVTFVNGSITTSTIQGTLKIPQFSSPIAITMSIANGGFSITFNNPGGIVVIDNADVKLTLNGLTIGKYGSVWQLGFSAAFNNKKELPAIGKIIPENFIIHNLLFKSDGSQTLFDIEALWKNGTTIRGNQDTGLKAYFAINKTAENGGFFLQGIQLNAKASPDLEIEGLLVGAGLKIGPVKATVDDVGARLKISNGNVGTGGVGPFGTDVSLIGPKGIGISIEAKVVSGTGYLHFSDGEYIGGIGLKIKSVTLNAIGIIATKMPDGEKGFSILVIITAEFPPVELVAGLALTGAGGLLGLHRTMNVTALQAGVKNQTLNAILFPQVSGKPEAVLQLAETIKEVFPIQRGQFVAGPMFKFVWARLVYIEIGVLVELDSPFRIAILGKISIEVPEKEKTVSIKVAFIGIIDFDRKYLAFDATIYDSKILTLSLYGDIAVRVFWGTQKEMILSVGGFHPAFSPDGDLMLPARMDRLTISIVNEKDLGLVLSVYLAVTSNTFQFGARLDFRFSFWVLKLVGYFGFDVLFQYDPFKFIARVYAGLALLWGSRELMSISLDFLLEGPEPWHAKGFAQFKVLGSSRKAEFDRTWGPTPPPATIPTISIVPLIVEALQMDENWVSYFPSNRQIAARILVPPGSGLVLHPFGTLGVSQKVVPLGIEIKRFGVAKPNDGTVFEMTKIVVGSTQYLNNTAGLYSVYESFAPAHFKEMKDDEKLEASSFENLRAGARISSIDGISISKYLRRTTTYDQVIIDKTNTVRNPLAMDRRLVNRYTGGGVLSKNAYSKAASANIKKPIKSVSIDQESYKLVSKDSLSDYLNGSRPTLAETLQLRDSLVQNNPSLKGTLEVIPVSGN